MTPKKTLLWLPALLAFLSPRALWAATETTSLDGVWQVRIDPDNVGKTDQWFARPLSESGEVSALEVPGVIQKNWPDYHGLAWYERTFATPDNPNQNGRYILRFWQAEYRADVWLNGVYLGFHEGGEVAFELDATEAMAPLGDSNRLTVRVLNAADTPIDGISMANVSHRYNMNTIIPGYGYSTGGLVDSVELLKTPAVRLTDLQLIPNWKTGEIEARATVENTLPGKIAAAIRLCAASSDGGTYVTPPGTEAIEIPQGKSTITSAITVPDFKLWELNDPNLYTVAAALDAYDLSQAAERKQIAADKRSAVCGFRDFRFERGSFRLNGKRIYLKCSHSTCETPITFRVPIDNDFFRRDILACKTMGFNMIRYIAGMPRRFQLDLCDRVGFLVYEECLSAWRFDKCPERPQRYLDNILGMIERDRNHPSVVIWGLLNETSEDELVLYAASLLPQIRRADPDRVIMLNSGSWDRFDAEAAGGVDYSAWRRKYAPHTPTAFKNGTDNEIIDDNTRWPAKTFFLHPGAAGGEYAAARFTAPTEGNYTVAARFFGTFLGGTTTSIDLFQGDKKIWSGDINLASGSNEAAYDGELRLAAGEVFSVVVGIGNENGGGDTTAVDLKITAPDGHFYDVMADCQFETNPCGVWSYGYLAPGDQPDLSTFTLFTLGQERFCYEPIGRCANPGDESWSNVLADTHPYRNVPHTPEIIQELRRHDSTFRPEFLPRRGADQPGSRAVFLSEYGIGSAVDLFRLARLFEQYHGTDAPDAKHYKARLDGFMADWNRWNLDDTFGSPEDFFRQAIARMAEQRRIGINAIRSNPRVISHSVTSTHDQAMAGEGLTTLWREYKPGTIDTMADLFAPLRFCHFAEPPQCFSGSEVHFESVLVNEDVLPPGDYPVRFIITGPNNTRLFDEVRTITIPTPPEGEENPFAISIFDETLPVAGPEGEYHFRAEFEQNAAACGGDERFWVTDRATLPAVEGPIAVWGSDPSLVDTLRGIGIDASPLDLTSARPEGLRIVVGQTAEHDDPGFDRLMKFVQAGARVLFLVPQQAAARVKDIPIVPGDVTFEQLPQWLYHKDDWTKRSAFFDSLPCGDVCDYIFYREVIPTFTFNGPQLIPDEVMAGAFNTQSGYSSGLSIAGWNVGSGRVVFSTWRILENLPGNPIAERLLRNMLRGL
ncbi:MAG: hypothetical protein IJG02_08290 [Thermoguttaceae bacterium]|nr:hypothetical protein [Thermoguttaceae bacterium]